MLAAVFKTESRQPPPARRCETCARSIAPARNAYGLIVPAAVHCSVHAGAFDLDYVCNQYRKSGSR
jgi:hypothetical protein